MLGGFNYKYTILVSVRPYMLGTNRVLIKFKQTSLSQRQIAEILLEVL